MHAHQPASSPQRPLVWPASAPPPLVGGVRFVFHDCLCSSSTEHIRSVLDRSKSSPLVCMGHMAARSDHVVLVSLAKLCYLSCISVLVDML